MRKRYIIYGLRDPRNGEIRYIGQSSTGLSRPKGHSSDSNMLKYKHLYVVRWLNKLKADGFVAEIVILEDLTKDVDGKHDTEKTKTLNDAEIKWIAIGRQALGKRLTNCTEGGGGLLGRRHSIETRQKMSAAYRAPTQEAIAKMAATKRAQVATPEGYAAMMRVAAMSRTPEVIAKVSKTRKEMYNTPGGKAHLARAAEKARSPEATAKRLSTRRATEESRIRVCTVDGCTLRGRGGGMCSKHYSNNWVNSNRDRVNANKRLRRRIEKMLDTDKLSSDQISTLVTNKIATMSDAQKTEMSEKQSSEQRTKQRSDNTRKHMAGLTEEQRAVRSIKIKEGKRSKRSK